MPFISACACASASLEYCCFEVHERSTSVSTRGSGSMRCLTYHSISAAAPAFGSGLGGGDLRGIGEGLRRGHGGQCGAGLGLFMTCGRSGIRRTLGAGFGVGVALSWLRRAISIMSLAAPFALGFTPPALTK